MSDKIFLPDEKPKGSSFGLDLGSRILGSTLLVALAIAFPFLMAESTPQDVDFWLMAIGAAIVFLAALTSIWAGFWLRWRK